MHKKIICCLLFIISIFACVSAYAAEVTDVRWGLDRFNVLRLVVDLDSPPVYNISFQGQTMLVTVNAKLGEKVTRSFKMRSTLAPTMTVEESGGNTVLKLPLARTIGTQDYNAFTLKNDPVTKRPNRLVVDITADKTATPSVVIPKADSSAEKAKAPVTVPKTSTAKTTVPKTTTPKTTAKVTVPKKTAVKTEEKKTAKSSFKTDGGLKGAKVSMTRTGDTDVYGPNASDSQELQARVDVAEDNDADAFVSIHINSSTNKSVGGFSSYYYPKTNNDARLAQAVQDRLVKNFGLDDLGIRKANFYVNKRCSMPSTLLELAFISNPKEEKLMNSNWYINKLAKSIADGIEDYFK